MNAGREKIAEEIQPELIAAIQENLGKEEWSLDLDPADPDGQSLDFTYPRTNSTLGTAAYLLPFVKIEFGVRSDHWPAEAGTISPYLAEALPESLDETSVKVKVLDARRTFWEKATILHQMAHLPNDRSFPGRYSRHYCDLAAMIEAGVGEAAARDDELLAAVVAHKRAFYRSAWASYETAIRGTLQLLPSEGRKSELTRDLAAMGVMFFDEPPRLDDVLDRLRTWEREFNMNKPR